MAELATELTALPNDSIIGDPTSLSASVPLFKVAMSEGAPEAAAEVLRSGYQWKGRVLRAAMVKVRG